MCHCPLSYGCGGTAVALALYKLGSAGIEKGTTGAGGRKVGGSLLVDGEVDVERLVLEQDTEGGGGGIEVIQLEALDEAVVDGPAGLTIK